MQVYRITLQKWAKNLYASGRAARWNSDGHFVIYTAGSRSLASLENIVHRSGVGLKQIFEVMLIDIPDDISIQEIKLNDLPKDWPNSYAPTQKIGNTWLRDRKSAVLKVPSAIIPMEPNFLLNPNHPDFYRIKLVGNENFEFDTRIKDV